MHWWQQVIDRPAVGNWDEVFDEMVCLRFQIGDEAKKLASSSGS